MADSFFTTPQYQKCFKLRAQLSTVNTDNNMLLYLDAAEKAIERCDKDFKSIGYKDGRYSWLTALNDKCGAVAPRMRKWKSQIIPDTMYIAEDGSRVVFKTDKGKYVVYTREEAMKLYGQLPKDKIAVHRIKTEFDGVLC